jgi:hypothetical protein
VIEVRHVLKALRLFPTPNSNAITVLGVRKISPNSLPDLSIDDGQTEALLSKLSSTSISPENSLLIAGEPIDRNDLDDNYETLPPKYETTVESLIPSTFPLSPKAKNILAFTAGELLHSLLLCINCANMEKITKNGTSSTSLFLILDVRMILHIRGYGWLLKEKQSVTPVPKAKLIGKVPYNHVILKNHVFEEFYYKPPPWKFHFNKIKNKAAWSSYGKIVAHQIHQLASRKVLYIPLAQFKTGISEAFDNHKNQVRSMSKKFEIII